MIAKYLRKWVPLGVVIGVLCGIASLILYQAIGWITFFLLSYVTGYVPPLPGGEGSVEFTYPSVPFLLPIVTCLGGLLSGLIVYLFAPEAEGHGTDAAIDAFHTTGGEVRVRVPLVKMVASALTIGSGGSAGPEGPIIQIGAGLGSFVGKMLRLNTHDRRIAEVAGMGAGVASIFKAPFGGALLSCEILYIRDFEVKALFPSLVASLVGYLLFSSVTGWAPLFGQASKYVFNPLNLPLYAILGLACGIVGVLFIKSFYRIAGLFHGLRIPCFLKPALGGVLVGFIGMFLPQVLGTGYGWLQIAMNEEFEKITMSIIVLTIFAKILATSLSVGSGGSGGLFAPALVIGGMLGASFYFVFRMIFPWLELDAASFIIAGMASFFGGVGKAPLATVIMVSEITRCYIIIIPSAVSTAVSYLVTGSHTIYRNQVFSRKHPLQYSH
ncbi:MAG: chloride channel protein [Crenarchaeota archaeon]|nr:chloride channel protein [Thermoproteota archaeon]MDW8033625.1 chloride channel protein [Nitrososphaerota archaeon]